MTVENTSLTDESGEIDVKFEEFDLDVDDDSQDGPEEDVRIDYTGSNVSDGTITVATTVSGTAPTAAGQYSVNVTDVEVVTDGTEEFLIEDANTEIATIDVADDGGDDDGTADDGTGEDDTTDDSTPGFGPLVTLVAVLIAAGLLGRRRGEH